MRNKAPVLFLVFNRPDTTQKVFLEIRKARPAKLYVAADGPRAGNVADAENCAKVRKIVKQVDWPCKVRYLFREKNLGCGRAVSGAITWFFKHEKMGIILEDDCLPDPTFFTFTTQLLEKYKNDTRIMMISGDNFQYNGGVGVPESYFFSKYTHVWGWATWRRAWGLYDFTMKQWPKLKSSGLSDRLFDSTEEKKYFSRAFDLISKDPAFTWDVQWLFSVWVQNGLSIYPSKNIVKNIGFEGAYTHTLLKRAFIESTPLEKMESITHPRFVERNIEADRFTFLRWYRKGLAKKLYEALPGQLKGIIKFSLARIRKFTG